jgi:sulfur relay (sulfurtransferase) complex TusBCD TusD component (DsrE family)
MFACNLRVKPRKEEAMKKEIALFLSTTPYSYENTHTVIRLAEAALEKGHGVRLIASGDGVFTIVKGQVPQALKALQDLVGKGMKVDI